jgi:hypothetical protein
VVWKGILAVSTETEDYRTDRYIAAVWRAVAKTLADRRLAYIATDERRYIIQTAERVEAQLRLTAQLYRTEPLMPDGDDGWDDDGYGEPEPDPWDAAMNNCYSRDGGRTCGAAGSEECEFECPFRQDYYRSVRKKARA